MLLFQGKMALLGSNNCFMSMDAEGDIVCSSRTAGTDEYIAVTAATIEQCMLLHLPKASYCIYFTICRYTLCYCVLSLDTILRQTSEKEQIRYSHRRAGKAKGRRGQLRVCTNFPYITDNSDAAL